MFILNPYSKVGRPFIIEIDTRNTKSGSTNDYQFKWTLSPATPDSYVDWRIDWGDGSSNIVTTKSDPNLTHTYASKGVYEIKVYTRSVLWVYLDYDYNQAESNKITKVKQWGNFMFFTRCFRNCQNLELSNISDVPKSLSILTNWSGIFNDTRFFSIDKLSQWEFTSATSISPLIYNNPNFNQSFTLNAPVATAITGNWLNSNFNGEMIINAPNLVDITQFFRQATAFNKDVSTWFDWTKITNMTNFMTGKTFSNYNASYYDNLLIALDLGGNTNVTLGMGTIRYTAAGSTARANLVSKGWTITDGGLAP